MFAWRVGIPALLAAVLISGCAYNQDIASPISRKLGWFSFLNGADIREGCVERRAVDRMRLVYNADYREQVRIYEVAAGIQDSGAASLRTIVVGQAPLPVIDPFNNGFAWRNDVREAPLSSEDWTALVGAVSGAAPRYSLAPGEELHSFETYWAVATCIAGEETFAVFKFDGGRMPPLAFDRMLFQWDQSDEPVREPAEPDAALYEYRTMRNLLERPDLADVFTLTVGEDGFESLPAWF